MPAFKSLAHIRLAWADCLSDAELDGILSAYERRLSDQAIMCREAMRRSSEAPNGSDPGRNERERLVWRSIDERQAAFYENEMAWTRELRSSLKDLA